jgi:hypothetical protein
MNARRMVRENLTTYERLEKLGLILPAKTRVPSRFRLAYQQAASRAKNGSRRNAV